MKVRTWIVVSLMLLVVAGSAWADGEKKGFLGVTLGQVEHDGMGREHVGVYIHTVLPDSAAEVAGLKSHDRIVAIDGVVVERLSDLQGALAQARPNDAVNVTLLRDGTEQTFTVVLGERPAEGAHGRWGVVVDQKRAWLGFHVQELGRQLAEYFEVEGGVLISEVLDEGPAMRAGLEAGDVLFEIDGQPIRDRGALHRFMTKVEPGSDVAVGVQRRGRPLTLHVTTGDHEEVHSTLQLIEHHKCMQNPGECHAEDGTFEMVLPHVEMKRQQGLHEHEQGENDD